MADSAEVSSKYVQQLLHREAPAAESALHRELLDLKAQITDAAAALELEKQAFQRARVRKSSQAVPSHAQDFLACRSPAGKFGAQPTWHYVRMHCWGSPVYTGRTGLLSLHLTI